MMSVCKTMKISRLIVLILVVQGMSQVPELSSTLHSTIYGVQVAYVGETVEFTCVIRESNSMSWSSDEYIGTGGQELEFLAAEMIGSTLAATGNRQTIATLVNTTGSDFIVSRLQITIMSNYQTPSVQCRNINADTTATITFLLADIISTTCDRQSVCPGEIVTCICVTWNSNTLNWTTINGNSLVFSSTDPLRTRRNVTGSSTFAVLTENSNRNGIRVIMSNLTFIASTMNVLACENVGQSTPKSVIIPISDTCSDPTIQVTTSIRNNVVGTSAGPIAAAVVLPIIFAVAALLIVIILVVVCHKKNKDLEQQHEKKIKGLLEDKDKLKGDLDDKKKELDDKKKELDDKKKELNDKEKEIIRSIGHTPHCRQLEFNSQETSGDVLTPLQHRYYYKQEKKLKQENEKLDKAKQKAEKELNETQQQVKKLEAQVAQEKQKQLESLKDPPQDPGSQVPSDRRKKLSIASDHDQTETFSSPQANDKPLGSELLRPPRSPRAKKRRSELTDNTAEKETLSSPKESDKQLGPELSKPPRSPRAKSPSRGKNRGSGKEPTESWKA